MKFTLDDGREAELDLFEDQRVAEVLVVCRVVEPDGADMVHTVGFDGFGESPGNVVSCGMIEVARHSAYKKMNKDL